VRKPSPPTEALDAVRVACPRRWHDTSLSKKSATAACLPCSRPPQGPRSLMTAAPSAEQHATTARALLCTWLKASASLTKRWLSCL
jgi:hypothetical protein